MTTERPITTQEFADRMKEHKESAPNFNAQVLPPNIYPLVEQARIKTRKSLNLKPEDVVVILGEQTYGLNESPKVIGKRLFAQGLKAEGVVPVELFASYDMAGSEGGIYRMQVPSPQSPEGFLAVNILPGLKKRKYVATAGFRCPTDEELSKTFATLGGLYGGVKTENFKDFLMHQYLSQPNYAAANINLLRQFEKQIGLQIERWVSENKIDTEIAVNGGMEVMLALWPALVKNAKKHEIEGVRVPNTNETPFNIYHNNGECMGRMQTEFLGKDSGQSLMEKPIEAVCMQCGHTENTSAQEIVETRRELTWRAIPRVVAYSVLGIADGHITGGGSIYNETAEAAVRANGFNYFPITHMISRGENGNRKAIFNYQSSAVPRLTDTHYKEASTFVKEGHAAMADLLLSVGVKNLRGAIDSAITKDFSTHTVVECPETLPKNSRVIEI